MSEEIKIKVFEVVGDELCVASSEGEKLYRRIHPFLKRGKKVVLSFSNISTITSAFFNSSIAPLYGDFDAELIRGSIVLEDMTDDDKLLLKRVADNAMLCRCEELTLLTDDIDFMHQGVQVLTANPKLL